MSSVFYVGPMIFSLNDGFVAPQMMKKNSLASNYMLTPIQVAILSSTQEPHAEDFLLTIPIDGLGQKINPRQFWSILCYRLTIPLFAEDSLYPSCNTAKMDVGGIMQFIAQVRLA